MVILKLKSNAANTQKECFKFNTAVELYFATKEFIRSFFSLTFTCNQKYMLMLQGMNLKVPFITVFIFEPLIKYYESFLYVQETQAMDHAFRMCIPDVLTK